MHRFSSRSDESTGLTRRVTRKRVPQAPANVLLSTLRRPRGTRLCGSRNTDRVDDFVAAVENLCIVRARALFQYRPNVFHDFCYVKVLVEYVEVNP